MKTLLYIKKALTLHQSWIYSIFIINLTLSNTDCNKSQLSLYAKNSQVDYILSESCKLDTTYYLSDSLPVTKIEKLNKSLKTHKKPNIKKLKSLDNN